MTRDTRELDFAHHRQMFLTEQGYSYEILDERDVIPREARGGVMLPSGPRSGKAPASRERERPE